MQNAVIYARYSSHGQNEQTIEGQIRVCKEYAQQHRLNIVGTYIDKHKTGTDVNRPQFQQMIEDAKTNSFNYIIVYMLDRFARNRYYSTMYTFQLMQNDVKVISATQNITESEEGELYQMFLEWEAEKYSKRLSKRVREGLTTSVANGTFTGGYINYGYKVIEKPLTATRNIKIVQLDEQTAPIVKYIFEQYADGVSKKDIADDLNTKGYRYNGKPFKGRSFDRILSNQKYTGTFYFGERLCNNTYPQIIDPLTFEKVQKRLSQNKYFSGANSAKIDYLLTGKLYCGHCGSPMVADGGTGKLGKSYHYYSCKQSKKHACNKKREKKDFAEWYATEQTQIYLSDPRRVAVIANDVIKYYESRTCNDELKRLQAERIKTQKEIDNAVNLLVSGVSPTVVKTLDAKITELTQLLNDLTVHQSKIEIEQGLKITKDDIVSFVADFIKGNPHDKEFQKRIIDNLINAFYIYDDKVVIYFNIKGGKETAFIGKDETDDAVKNIENTSGCECSNFNYSAPPSATMFEHQQIYYIFVNGVAGIVVYRKDTNN